MRIIHNIAHLNVREQTVSGHQKFPATVSRVLEVSDIVELRHTALRGLTTNFEVATPDQQEAIYQQELKLHREASVVETMIGEVVEFVDQR